MVVGGNSGRSKSSFFAIKFGECIVEFCEFGITRNSPEWPENSSSASMVEIEHVDSLRLSTLILSAE